MSNALSLFLFLVLCVTASLDVVSNQVFSYAPKRLRQSVVENQRSTIAQPSFVITDDATEELRWTYSSHTKAWPYAGHPDYLGRYKDPNSRQYLNSLAVFPGATQKREHGVLGRFPNGTYAYVPKPSPPPVTPETADALLADGGFYLALSDALPLDRDPPDNRPSLCQSVVYDIDTFEDVSVIITFYNEPVSTLMRSVHSVLNRTPPPLLRELILVDDHSNRTDQYSKNFLYEYIALLPKVKLVTLPERRGLVAARLIGARVASAPVLVVLDSHIEVTDGWLEPQLQRLKESPKSIVFPQIPSIDSENFSLITTHGIGCVISFKWVMQEASQPVITPTSADPIASPSMAGGLFAVRADWFWELGGYDEDFSMWGAENVEMGFRTWMCGGRLECVPCSLVYHIYRHKGKGYSSPSVALQKNRLRTARIWTDELYQLAKLFISPDKTTEIGSLDAMLELKQRLQCKPFQWYLDNVDKLQALRKITAFPLSGQIRNVYASWMCVDTLANSKSGKPYGGFHCHEGGGTQGFLFDSTHQMLISYLDESVCLGPEFRLVSCSELQDKPGKWFLDDFQLIRWSASETDSSCLSFNSSDKPEERLMFQPCNPNDTALQWTYSPFEPDEHFQLPDLSDHYKAEHQLS